VPQLNISLLTKNSPALRTFSEWTTAPAPQVFSLYQEPKVCLGQPSPEWPVHQRQLLWMPAPVVQQQQSLGWLEGLHSEWHLSLERTEVLNSRQHLILGKPEVLVRRRVEQSFPRQVSIGSLQTGSKPAYIHKE
jgi:hypothetical protein